MSDMYLDWETKMALKEYANKSYAELMKEQDPDPPEQAGDFYVHGKWVTRYFGPGGDVAIPEGFTRICCGVFQDCEGAADVTGITIPKSVTRIDDHVFPYCANLKEIRVEAGNPRYCVVDGLLMEKDSMVLHSCPPARGGVLSISEGVTEIGDSAFACCSNLTEVVILEGVAKIGNDAFKFCSGLTSVAIPEGVISIGWRAFWNCSSLKDVAIPKSVTNIDSDAFSNCTNLTSVMIPKDVAHIGWSAFEGCTNLEEIRVEAGNQRFCAIDGMLLERDGSTLYLHTCPAAKSGILAIPEGVSQIAECAFSGCSGLTEVVIPGSVREIGECAFSSCSGLTEVIIPGSVREIGDSAFSGCSSLTEVIIPEGVIRIGDSAFKGCTNLTHVVFPESVCEIGYGAFEGASMSEEAVQAAYDRTEERELELEVKAFGRLIAEEDSLDEVILDLTDDDR